MTRTKHPDGGSNFAMLERRFKRERAARKAAEKLLEEKSQELYIARLDAEVSLDAMLNAIESLRDGFAIVDLDFCIVRSNSAFNEILERCTGSSVVKQNLLVTLTEICPAETDFTSHQDSILNALRHSSTYEFAGVNGIVLELSAGDVLAFGQTVILRDIVGYKREEERKSAARKSQALGSLAGGIAHELATPLQFIGDNLTFVRDSFATLNSVFDHLSEEFCDSCDRMQLLSDVFVRYDIDYIRSELPAALDAAAKGSSQISKVISAMRFYTEQNKGEREPVDIEMLLKSIVTLSRNKWVYACSFEVRCELENTIVNVIADGLTQVFLNLILNSAEAIGSMDSNLTRHQHKIQIVIRRVSDDLIIVFEDTGPGIGESNIDKVFDPFFTMKLDGESMGQGLSVSSSIINDDHNGHLSVSRSVLGGARFEIRIPGSFDY